MKPRSILYGTSLASLCALGLIGCMKRKETLTISPDGGLKVQLAYEADSRDELYGGDAMPAPAGGWAVRESIEVEKDGKETYKLDAEATFEPGARLPDSYASPSDPDADLFLRFPTVISREERPDGTYYHFRRVYPARPWAPVETLRKMALDEKTEAISEKDPSQVTQEDRVMLVQALADAAVGGMATLGRAAFVEVTPDAPQDAWLRAEAALKALRDELDYGRLAGLMENPDKEMADKLLAQEAEALEEGGLERLIVELERAGYSDAQSAAFRARYDWHKRYYDVTGDLGDDNFEVSVVMPGEIVAADMLARIDGAEAHWEFNGEFFRDRDLELMATSRVGN